MRRAGGIVRNCIQIVMHCYRSLIIIVSDIVYGPIALLIIDLFHHSLET